jgi:hypothetical protein
MNTMPGSAQSEFVVASSLVKPSAEAPAIGWANPKNDELPAKRSWLGKMDPLTFAPHAITLLIGVAATLAWQTYGDTAKNMIAAVASSPNKQPFNAILLDLDAMRQSIDALATNIDRLTTNVAAKQEHIMRSVDQLAASQEQMTREIGKLQSVEQYVLHKNSDPPTRPAPTPAPKPVQRPSQPSQPPSALTPAKNP